MSSLAARYQLEPSGHSAKAREPALDRGRRNVERRRDGDGGEDVRDVRAPDEPRSHVHGALRRPRVELETFKRQRQRAGGHVGLLVDRVGDRQRHRLSQRFTAWIVEVDDARRAGRQHVEQPPLRGEVRLHVAVIVEMVPRQIREHARSERRAVDTPKRECVRRHFHDACAAARVDHLPKHPLHVWCLRCRARGGQLLVANRVADGAEKPALFSRRFEHGA